MKRAKWLLLLMAACMFLLAACGGVTSDPTDTTEQVKEIVVGKTNRERDGEFP